MTTMILEVYVPCDDERGQSCMKILFERNPRPVNLNSEPRVDERPKFNSFSIAWIQKREILRSGQ